MLLKTIFLMLPALAFGSIKVYIKASSPETGAHVEYLGANLNIIPEIDIKTFGLEGDRLKEAVKAISGTLPTEAFVKNPLDAKNADLYERNQWNQVNRRVIPMTGEILSFKSEPFEVMSENIINTNDELTIHKIEMKAELFNTVEGFFTNGGEILRGERILHEIEYGIDSVDDIIKHSFEVQFARNIYEIKPFEVYKEIEVELKPWEEVEAVLTNTKVTMNLQVNYTLNLAGDVACFFADTLYDQNYWAYDVNRVLEAANMPTSLQWTEMLTVTYYSDSEISTRNKNS